MSTALAVAEERGQSLAELMGVTQTAPTASGPSIARITQIHKPVEKEVNIDGDKLMKKILPIGSYKISMGEDKIIYSPTVSIRIFAQRQQWQRWNGDTQEMEKSVMASSLNGDLKDNIGTFNLGRPSGYIKDFNSLPNATKEVMRSVKRVKVFMGLLTVSDPRNASGDIIDEGYVDVPFVMDVKNRDSIKSLDSALQRLQMSNMLPIMSTINLSGVVDSIPTGAEFGKIKAELGNRVEITDLDNETLKNFLDFIEYVNGNILNKYSERCGDGMSASEKEIVANIIEVEEEAA
tara:strand:- start:2565 stop:3440 length:876 start_codon:yes stop_codon:yes gene_type:complete